MKRLLLFLSCITLYSNLSYAQGPIYRITYSLDIMDDSLAHSGQLRVKPNRYKQFKAMESQVEDKEAALIVWINENYAQYEWQVPQKSSILLDFDQNEAFVINYGDSTYEKLLSFNAKNAFSKFSFQHIQDTVVGIAGYPCKVAELNYQEAEGYYYLGAERIKIWYHELLPKISIENFEFLNALPGAALKLDYGGIVLTATEVKKLAKHPTDFKVPSGFTLVETPQVAEGNDMSLGEGLIAYCDSTLSFYGIMTEQGEIITPLKYSDIRSFNNGISVAYNLESKCGLIDRKGHIVLPFDYDFLRYDYELGQYRFQKNGKYGMMDKSGHLLWDKKYDEMSSFKFGLALVGNGGFFGLVDEEGKEVLPIKYQNLVSYDDQYYVIKVNDQCEVYDLNSGQLMLKGYQEIQPSGADHIFIVSADGHHFGYVDQHGKVIIPLSYFFVSRLENEVFKVRKVGWEYDVYFDKKGVQVFVSDDKE